MSVEIKFKLKHQRLRKEKLLVDEGTPSIELIETKNDIIPYHTSFLIEQDTSSDLKESSKLLPSVKQETNCYQLVSCIEEFEQLFREHEVEMYTRYTIYKTNGSFIEKGKDPERTPRVHWGALSKVSSDLANIPYLILGTRYYVCHLGKCNYTKKLQKYSTSKDNKRKYKKVTDSKKVGCPANFKVQRLILFPDNKLYLDTRSERARMGETIKKNIGSIRIEQKYLFKFPDLSEHENHMEQHIAVGKEPIDERVVRKVREIVMSGTNGVFAVTNLLEKFVESDINIVDKSRRRFYPNKSDIQRIIYKAKLKLRKIKNDQEKVKAYISSLGNSNEIYFQPSNFESNLTECHLASEGTHSIYRKYGFLFVYQSLEMRRLFNLYGHHCILLDPTFRFSKYSFPMYFVAVQTNVNYQITAFFITEHETREALVEALSIIAHWNPSISPKYAMVDNAIDEIKALEIVYPEISVFISSYYCKVSWEQRLLISDMIDFEEEALEKFKAILNASTEDRAQKAINNLKSQNELKDYFEKDWQKEIKKWAKVYRPPDFIFESNSAVERLHEEFRHSTLLQMKDFTLSEMIAQMCEHFIPEAIEIYKTLNLKILQRHSEKCLYIPFNLLQSPQWILDIIEQVTFCAEQSLPFSYVEYLDEGKYSLTCKKTHFKNSVSFFPKEKYLTCTCSYFMERRVICEHIILVGRFYPTWNMEKICTWLFDNPIFKFDSFDANIQTLSHVQSQSELEGTFRKIANKNTNIIVTNESTNGTSSNLKDSCKQHLRSLETVINTIDPSELDEFHNSLKEFILKWSLPRRNKPEVQKPEVGERSEDDIPFPILQKISDLYYTKEKKIQLLNRKRRKRKVKYKKRNLAKIGKADDDIEMCSIETFYEEENHLPLKTFTVKADPLNEAEELRNTKETLEEYFDDKGDIVIQINNPEENFLDTGNL